MAGCVGSAWAQARQPVSGKEDFSPENPMYWIRRWHAATAGHPYMGTVTVVHGHGPARTARVWHGVRGGQQVDRIDMTVGNAPRTLLRSGRDVVVWEEKNQRRRQALHEVPPFGAPFAVAAEMEYAQLRQAMQYYRVVPLGRQRVADYQAEAIGFMPTDRLRVPHRFWTEPQTGLLLKWQTLEFDAAEPSKTWEQARVLREIAFSDVQVPAPVDFAMLQNMLQESPAFKSTRRAGRPRLPDTTSLQAEGWAWREPLPGYVIRQCQWRKLPGMQREPGVARHAPPGSPELAANAKGQPQALHCLLTDGLAHFSVFIGPNPQQQNRHEPKHAKERTAHMASRVYGGNYRITAVGAVPQQILQRAVDALYRP